MNGDAAAANQPASLVQNAGAAGGGAQPANSQQSPAQNPNSSHPGSTSSVIQSSSATTGGVGAGNAVIVLENEQVAIQDNDRGLGSGTEPSKAVDSELEGLLTEQVNGQGEVVDQLSDTAAGSSDSGGNSNDEGHDWLPENDHELKRVKVGHYIFYHVLLAYSAIGLEPFSTSPSVS